MATNDELVRYLTSAANYESEGTGYYLHAKGGNLTEKLFDGAEWSLPVQIGASKGAAAYLAGKAKRVVFTVDATNTLQNYVYNPDEDSWEQGRVNSAGARPHAQSNVTATIENGKPHVYFQDASGALHEVNTEDGETWHDGGALSAGKPIAGSALSNITVGEDVIYLFYQHEDSSIHYLVKDNKQGSWTDKQLHNGQVTGTVTRLITAGPNDKGEFDVYYLTKDGHIVHISPEEKTEIGTLDADGKFKASTSAECWRPCGGCWPPPPPCCYPRYNCCW